MKRILVAVLLLTLGITGHVAAQDTLPQFTAISKPGNRNMISWTNPYTDASQISIQRSADSLKNFKTILTVPDPNVPQNGFVDTKAPAHHMYYRLFIVRDGGKYVFSRSKRPGPDTEVLTTADPLLKSENQRVITDNLNSKEVKDLKEKLQPVASTPAAPKPEKYFVVKRGDSLIGRVTQKYMKKFRDSIIYSTRDTLLFESVDTILIKPYVPKEIYKASKHVFTEKYGNITIALPEAGHKKYSIHFFEVDKSPLFEIKEVRSPSLIIDKTSFVHSGWFWFELYEEGKLKEKNKFYIPKDF